MTPPGATRRASTALIWPVALLVVFGAFVRTLGDRVRPAAAVLDCDRVSGRGVSDLERCLALRPDDVELMMDLGSAYEQAAETERAEAVYRRALEIDGDDGELRVRLGHLLLRRGDAAGARREGVAALAVQPGRSAVLDLIRRASESGDVR